MSHATPCPWLTMTETTAALPAAYAALSQAQAKALSTVGMPTRANERWKYADLQFLNTGTFTAATVANDAWVKQEIKKLKEELGDHVCVQAMLNGAWMASLSDPLPLGFQITCLATACEQSLVPLTPVDAKAYPFAALNQSQLNQGLVLQGKTKTKGEQVIHVLSCVSADQAVYVNPTMVVTLAEECQLTLVEHVMADVKTQAVLNQLTYIHLSDHAALAWLKIQTLPSGVSQFSHYEVTQAKESHFQWVNVTEGARFSRDEVIVNLAATGATCETAGFYQGKHAYQFADNHVEINHQAPHTQSDMCYKGVLDQKTKAVFNGRLLVTPGAQRISAHQVNHTILLSNSAEMYSKPELEIYADDVKCKHGATTGQLDEDALFYLQSRGIDKTSAQAMLMAGFMDEVMEKITNHQLRALAKSRVLSA